MFKSPYSRFDRIFHPWSHSTPENSIAAILRSAPAILEPVKRAFPRFMFG
jgi:hypothetical protein